MTRHDTPRADALAWAAGSDAPEKPSLNIGFLPLADSASLIVAATQGFAQPYGLTLNLRRQASWSGVRDRLLSGELDAVQGLYGLIYGVHLGLGAPATPMAVLMGLSQNGQSINLSNDMRALGVTSGEALARHVHHGGAKLCLAHTFPTGTHAMWLNYWLASHGVHPMHDIESVVVPPPMMVDHIRARRIDGFCAGEPWGARAVAEGMGITVATSQSIWPDHPEKVLGTTQAFVDRYPNAARALIMAVLDASRFLDENRANRESSAHLLAGPDFVATPASALAPRMLGDYTDGLGQHWQDAHALRFHGAGAVNMPYLSDGMWFMTQFRRWGLLEHDPDYTALARQVQQLDIYREAASALGIEIPACAMRSSTLADGTLWDGSDPLAYAHGFSINALAGKPSAPSVTAG
ncbi:ABC transporter substrate-binding protein [Halopseudomonas nanhaiensis]|uniref:CmpA/NrtA family ABC transporter substrate-binding protein n=1 Tax=Halopseudomonas nanhaiensis TaxID=2830842 RepID=UPI001CBDAEC2|nr:CmpA/NrtA family ABC transporter substrate-binding protein [Halopseudomonas nanhaiensis]UAW99554.1 ABC transporter substrate-binding protein [Halopseudomonas nanhaiensis]